MRQTTKFALLCASAIALCAPAFAAAPLITAPVDEAVLATVANERPVAFHTVTDKGALDDAHVLPHINLVLKRSPAQQAAFDKLVADQLNPKSASYHKWLSPADLRAYGPAEADIAKTVAWLQSHGLTVNKVSPSGMSIDFAGTARQVSEAFHTTLHSVALANGELHTANMTDPAIPAALTPVVRGATLSNFFPKPDMQRRSPDLTIHYGTGIYAVGPADFSTIYNVKPLYSADANQDSVKITGAGVTIAVVEQTDILAADWTTFRTRFHLTHYKGTLTLTHPGGCGDAGFIPDEGEAALDAEWSSAVAPDAAIIEASCPETETTFGVETTLQNLVELGTTASTLSISYGGSEEANGLTFLQGWANLLEEGASEGLSIMISSGDSGVSSSEGSVTRSGLAVNGLSTNAYNTTLGGTDFYDTALGTNAKYWLKKNNPQLQSAISYIPEIPWDNSCASSIIVKYLGYKNSTESCNATPKKFFEQQGVGGSGGQSVYYAKPSWQQGILGMPNDGVRDQPDVSLFAANGIWNHFYILCMSDPNEGGVPCDYSNLNDLFGNAAGGTSFAAPAFAGVMALVAQYKGTKLGVVAPRLYQIAQMQFSNPLLLSRCNSTLGAAVSSGCVFYNVTAGNNAEPCFKDTINCYTAGGAPKGIGVLSADNKAPYTDAFPARPGYSLATGLGTVNVTNLVFNY